MKRLFVLYDAHCELCRRCRVWLGQQHAFVPLTFIPFQSPEAECRFPGLKSLQPEKEIVVISDLGEVWRGGGAWVMCLWALQEYREWSQRLAHPLLLPLARRACELVSNHRHEVSRWLEDDSTSVVAQRLAATPAQSCAHTGYCKPR